MTLALKLKMVNLTGTHQTQKVGHSQQVCSPSRQVSVHLEEVLSLFCAFVLLICLLVFDRYSEQFCSLRGSVYLGDFFSVVCKRDT